MCFRQWFWWVYIGFLRNIGDCIIVSRLGDLRLKQWVTYIRRKAAEGLGFRVRSMLLALTHENLEIRLVSVNNNIGHMIKGLNYVPQTFYNTDSITILLTLAFEPGPAPAVC